MLRSNRSRISGALVALGVLAGACSSAADPTDSGSALRTAEDTAPSVTSTTAPAGTTTSDSAASADSDGSGTTLVAPDSGNGPDAAALADDPTLALDTGTGAPDRDAYVPLVPPAETMGRAGYSRYVYTSAGGEIIPALVEGPRAQQVRCQDPELPCSYNDLRELAESGAAIPPALELTPTELGKLVDELGQVEATMAAYADPNVACAEGYEPDRAQTPNMGSHFTSYRRIADGRFDPANPEIMLYAKRDGAPDGRLGRCRDGAWDGVDVELVGVAFFAPRQVTGEDHFEGFTGDLDNWHIHYNLCRLDGRDVTVPPDQCDDGTPAGAPNMPRGDASEGWMIHAWADPDHDNQLGVFSMWNPTIWPVADPTAVLDRGSLSRTSASTNLIRDFLLPTIELDKPGTVSFFNADAVAHTVTAGTPTDPSGATFDSDIIGGRDVADITIDEPGTYDYFCIIHPEMRGQIKVG